VENSRPMHAFSPTAASLRLFPACLFAVRQVRILLFVIVYRVFQNKWHKVCHAISYSMCPRIVTFALKYTA